MAVARPGNRGPLPRRGLWCDLDSPGDAVSNITPNWFAAVMGTGIVAVAAYSLPVQPAGLHTFAVVVWVLTAALLLALLTATAAHWRRFPAAAHAHHLDPVIGHFYGAPAMALLVTGAGALLLGRDLLGESLAIGVDWVLWFAGTLVGLLVTVAIPYVQYARHGVRSADVFAGWLMPIVPPIVSASTGALLVPHAPSGPARVTMLVACYVLFMIGLIASVVVMALFARRLVAHGVGEARLVPTVWIALGPLGQSITAVSLLGTAATQAVPAHAHALRTFGLVYGIPVWALAALFGAFALSVTVRTARDRLPFSLTWWSFTFPVGTCVTGSTELFLTTGFGAFRVAAVTLYLGLLGAWALVLTRTARGCWRGNLLRPTPATPAPAR